MESATLELVHQLLGLLMIVLIAGMFGGRLAAFLRVPDVAVFLLVGVLIGPILHWVHLGASTAVDQTIVIVGASLILFDGGREIRLGVLKKVWLTITLLSVPGVLVTAGVVGAAAYYLLHLPLLYCFLLASVVASTDPATLIPVFRQVAIEDRVKETVESESAFNDATASIVTMTLLSLIMGESSFSLGGSVLQFLKMAGGGLIIGLGSGWVASLLITNRRSGFLRDYAKVILITVAIGSYLLGDLLGFSGFMATFTAGLVLGNHNAFGWPVDDRQLHVTGHFFEGVTLILRMLIFVLLGTQVDFSALSDYWWQGLLLVVVLMFVARPLTVFLCAGPDRLAKWKWNELLFMCWVRETGVIPAALVAMIASLNLPHYRAIQSVTFMAILVTIILQAGTTGLVAKRLGVEKKKHSSGQIGAK